MHATFWHLIHFVAVTMLCLLWAPGELFSMFTTPTELHRELYDEDSSVNVNLVSEGQQGKSE